jgi:hypothetical protein
MPFEYLECFFAALNVRPLVTVALIKGPQSLSDLIRSGDILLKSKSRTNYTVSGSLSIHAFIWGRMESLS